MGAAGSFFCSLASLIAQTSILAGAREIPHMQKRSMMNSHIRPFSPDDMENVVQLSLLTWAPVFHSFEQVLGARIYALLFPDWKESQRATVEKMCREHEQTFVWVAETHGTITGFIVYTLNSQENGQENTGEVELLAVHPDYQNRGIGTELNHFALEKMRASGIKLAIVATGGDPGHAPARRSYEKAGYTALPGVRYYQAL
jgi:GNAT superfamily N-acetyltransferase